METYVSQAEQFSTNYMENPTISQAIARQELETGPRSIAEVKTMLRDELFTGDKPAA